MWTLSQQTTHLLKRLAGKSLYMGMSPKVVQQGWACGGDPRSLSPSRPFKNTSTKYPLFRKLRSSICLEERRVWVGTQVLGWKSNQLWLCCSSSDQSASDPQSSHSRAEPTPPAAHPQPFSRVPRPPHLHQNPGECRGDDGGYDWCRIFNFYWLLGQKLINKRWAQNSECLFLLINSLAQKNYVLQIGSQKHS